MFSEGRRSLRLDHVCVLISCSHDGVVVESVTKLLIVLGLRRRGVRAYFSMLVTVPSDQLTQYFLSGCSGGERVTIPSPFPLSQVRCPLRSEGNAFDCRVVWWGLWFVFWIGSRSG